MRTVSIIAAPSKSRRVSAYALGIASAPRNTETWGEAAAWHARRLVVDGRRTGISRRRMVTAATRVEERQVKMVRGFEVRRRRPTRAKWKSREGSGEVSAKA